MDPSRLTGEHLYTLCALLGLCVMNTMFGLIKVYGNILALRYGIVLIMF